MLPKHGCASPQPGLRPHIPEGCSNSHQLYRTIVAKVTTAVPLRQYEYSTCTSFWAWGIAVRYWNVFSSQGKTCFVEYVCVSSNLGTTYPEVLL